MANSNIAGKPLVKSKNKIIKNIIRFPARVKGFLLRKSKKILLKKLVPNDFYFSHKGYCPCCEHEVVFESYHHWLRDNLYCSRCRCIPRERALILAIEKHYPGWRNLKIHESSPASTRSSSKKLESQCKDYTATQFYPNEKFGTVINNFRNENLEEQTFPDESFDIIVTQDVMEHVYHPDKAFKEIARTLKKGGAHIFTVPIINKHKKTEVWAVLGKNGEPEFLQKPEYHGNPVNPKGSPVTMHWGFDIVDFIKENGGLDTAIEYMDDLEHGVRAEYIEVLVSKRNS